MRGLQEEPIALHIATKVFALIVPLQLYARYAFPHFADGEAVDHLPVVL